MRKGRHAFRFLALAVSPMAFVAGCADADEGGRQGEKVETTGLALSADFSNSSDVAAMRFTVTPVDCGTGLPAGAPVVTDRSLEDFTIPGGIGALEDAPLDEDSSHRFADHFSDVPAGCYDVETQPLNEAAQPSLACAPATKRLVEVLEGQTTEVMLINQCHGPDSGTIDLIAALNHDPQVGVEFEDSKFVCSGAAQVICANAIDADEDPLEFVWNVSGGSAITGPTVVRAEYDAATNTRTECIEVSASTAGRFDVSVTVYDLGWRDGVPIRIEDLLALEGYPSESRGEMSFFFYATDCDESPEASLESVGTVVWSVSADGTTAVGYSDPPRMGFRWNGSLEALGTPAGVSYADPIGVSGDGRVILAQGVWTSTSTSPLLWTDGSWQDLGLLSGTEGTAAGDVSASGDVVVGWGDTPTGGRVPFLWNASDGMVELPMPAAYSNAEVHATSADGTVHAGYAWGTLGERAVVWHGNVPTVLPSDGDAEGLAISGDGNVVGGSANSGFDPRPVLWANGAARDLGDLPGGSGGIVWALNADGTVAVGYAISDAPLEATVWDEAHGLRSVRDVLVSAGVDVSDWKLEAAYGVSADGKVIGGEGRRISTGSNEGWVAHLP
jgi:probable HAF family extracellular repeat protein